MPESDGPEAPLTFEQVLAQEDAVLGEKQRSALCISGGGIRSATFALGATDCAVAGKGGGPSRVLGPILPF